MSDVPRKLVTALLCAMAIGLVGCPKRSKLPSPPPGQAPLELALDALEVDDADLTLPRAEEAGYTVVTSSPTIDSLLSSPLELPRFGEQLGTTLDQVTTPSELLASVEWLPGSASESAKATGQSLAEDSDKTATPPSPPNLPTAVFDSAGGQLALGHVDSELRSEFRRLIAVAESAALSLNRCQDDGKLRPPAIAAEQFFIEQWAGQLRYKNHPTGMQERFLEEASRLSLSCINDASIDLLQRLEALLPGLQSAAAKDSRTGPATVRLDSIFGPIVLGSAGSNRYEGDAFLTVDTGGEDRWQGGAGSNLGLPSPLSIAIDLGGRDEYRCERAHCQGAGYGGVGVLIDAGPEGDSYQGGPQSQGAGMLGLGLLWDFGGDDVFEASSYGQGAGTLGVGLLLDQAGNDLAVIPARGQGFAATGGLGIYADLDGADQRRLGLAGEAPHGPVSGGGQGGAWGTRSLPWRGAPSLHGGIGLLYDRAGNDGYYARAFGQASAWMLSLGLLIDRAGDDNYVAEWFGQASAQHLSAALLLDGGGSDRYRGTNRVQASANDRSAAILWDQSEDSDRYELTTVGTALERELGPGQAWASGPHGLSLLVDSGGDDQYLGRRDGLAAALPSSRPDRHSRAVLLDLGGADSYLSGPSRNGGNPADGASWLQRRQAVGMDTLSDRPGWPDFEATTDTDVAADSKQALPSEVTLWRELDESYRAILSSVPKAGAIETLLERFPEDRLVQIAETHAEPSLRRAAARLLVARLDLRGWDLLIKSLEHQSEDTRRPRALSSLPYWLSVGTGINNLSSLAEWRSAWVEVREELDLDRSWQHVQALDGMLLASGKGETTEIRSICAEARDWDVEKVTEACAQLLGFWAWSLGHPEAGTRGDLELAIELGQIAVQLAPDSSEKFIYLATALYGHGDKDLATRALEKARILDPDAPALRALERRMAGEEKP